MVLSRVMAALTRKNSISKVSGSQQQCGSVNRNCSHAFQHSSNFLCHWMTFCMLRTGVQPILDYTDTYDTDMGMCMRPIPMPLRDRPIHKNAQYPLPSEKPSR